jgi:hypothetical protein
MSQTDHLRPDEISRMMFYLKMFKKTLRIQKDSNFEVKKTVFMEILHGYCRK